jgi:hypothetical protein
MSCQDKNKHRTEREALDHLAWARKQRHQEGSHGLRHLNVYRCGDHWHVGRSHRSEREATGPILSAAKIRRKLENLGREIEADNRRWLEEQNRRAQEQARHAEELAQQARDHAEVMAEIERLVNAVTRH